MSFWSAFPNRSFLALHSSDLPVEEHYRRMKVCFYSMTHRALLSDEDVVDATADKLVLFGLLLAKRHQVLAT